MNRGPGVALGTSKESVVSVQNGQAVEIVLQNAHLNNGIPEFNLWHIYGHSFWIVGCGPGVFMIKQHRYLPTIYKILYCVILLFLQSYSWVALRS
jgi:Multicopper oxidase